MSHSQQKCVGSYTTKGKIVQYSTLRIEVLSSQAHMNHEKFEVLIASLVFETLPKEI